MSEPDWQRSFEAQLTDWENGDLGTGNLMYGSKVVFHDIDGDGLQ